MLILRISRSETAIAFPQSRDRFSRSENRLIWVTWISRAGKLVCDKQAGRNKAKCELSLSHAPIYPPKETGQINSKMRCERRPSHPSVPYCFRSRGKVNINELQRNTRQRQRSGQCQQSTRLS